MRSTYRLGGASEPSASEPLATWRRQVRAQISNRESLRLETIVTPRKQRIRPTSNRESEAIPGIMRRGGYSDTPRVRRTMAESRSPRLRISNRECFRLENVVTQRKQTIVPNSNREFDAGILSNAQRWLVFKRKAKTRGHTGPVVNPGPYRSRTASPKARVCWSTSASEVAGDIRAMLWKGVRRRPRFRACRCR
jgi:hypothetical protein